MGSTLVLFLFLLVANSLPAAAQRLSLPLRFETNLGQAPPEVRYVGQAHGYSVDFTDRNIRLRVGPHPLQLSFLNSNQPSAIEPLEEMAARTNWYGGAPARSITGIRNYERLLYRDVY